MTATNLKDATTAYSEADDAWQAELEKTFGKDAGTQRYYDAGKGTPGTALRAAYERYAAAMAAWQPLFDKARSERAHAVGV
jgi:hypothetical protein